MRGGGAAPPYAVLGQKQTAVVGIRCWSRSRAVIESVNCRVETSITHCERSWALLTDMKTHPASILGTATNQPIRSHSPVVFDHRRRWRSSLMSTRVLFVLLLLTTGCKTFNCTEDDLDRERQRLADSYAKGEAWGGAGMSPSGVTFTPDLGHISCPGSIGNACRANAPGAGGGRK